MNYKIVRTFYKKWNVDDWRCPENFWLPVMIASIAILGFSQAQGWININLTWLKIWLAPKVYLLETFANVLN